MTIKITFKDLKAQEDAGDAELGFPISPEDNATHFHATFQVEVAGKAVPMDGFFGDDDACIGDWAAELMAASKTLGSKDPSSHHYWGGEMDQPKYTFTRKGETVQISVQEPDNAEPRSGEIYSISLEAFTREVARFVQELEQVVEAREPGLGRKWREEWLEDK